MRDPDAVRAAANAVRAAYWFGKKRGVLIERDQWGRWASAAVGRGEAGRCEALPDSWQPPAGNA